MVQTFVRKIWLFLFLPLQLTSCQNNIPKEEAMNELEKLFCLKTKL